MSTAQTVGIWCAGWRQWRIGSLVLAILFVAAEPETEFWTGSGPALSLAKLRLDN